jgi:hypothetical protein
MNKRHGRSARINVLQLSDSEKGKFIQEARKALRERVENAKLWRALVESDGLTINGQPILF